MKVRILQKFHDKASYNTVYLVGETVTFDDARAEYLIGRGLAESAEDVAEAPAEDAPVVKPVVTRRKSTPKED